MDATKLRPSRNLEERLQANLPIDRAFIAGRIGAIYSALADCGIYIERLENHSDWTWLADELREAGEALSTLQSDLAIKGDTL